MPTAAMGVIGLGGADDAGVASRGAACAAVTVHRCPQAAGHCAEVANHACMCPTWPPWPQPWHQMNSPRTVWWLAHAETSHDTLVGACERAYTQPPCGPVGWPYQRAHWLTTFWQALHAK